MDDGGRGKASQPAGAAEERLTQVIAFHRATLGTPIDDHFMTLEHSRQMPLPPEPAPQWQQTGEYLVTRMTCTFEVPAAERAMILAAARWPLAGVITVQQESYIRHVLARGIYLLPSPLTESERTALRTRQEIQLREFDESVAQTRATLLQLAEDGADPLLVLSVLIRYMSVKGTAAPVGQSVTLESQEFRLDVLGDRPPNPLAPLADWEAGRIDKLPFRLEASKEIPPQPLKRQKPGPAEAAPTIGMALLADHLAANTRQRQPRASDIAELVRVWAPWLRGEAYLTGKHVYNRVRRTKKSEDYRIVVQDEKVRSEAEAALYFGPR